MHVEYLKLGALLKAHTNICYHISQILHRLWCTIWVIRGNQHFQFFRMCFRRACVALLGTTNKLRSSLRVLTTNPIKGDYL